MGRPDQRQVSVQPAATLLKSRAGAYPLAGKAAEPPSRGIRSRGPPGYGRLPGIMDLSSARRHTEHAKSSEARARSDRERADEGWGSVALLRPATPLAVPLLGLLRRAGEVIA
jgi:hypothetical protein